MTAAETRSALEAFRQAVETGDLQRLLDTLAPDVVLLGDGGGVKQAALVPIVGAADVAVIAVRIDDGRITGLYAVRNPEKLSRMDRETVLHR